MPKRTRSETRSSQVNVGHEDDFWYTDPELVRQVVERRPDYEQIVDEIVYILTKHIADAGIEVASVTGRAKTLNSFLKKIQRKSYDSPLDEVTDFAGVRVVCLYREDVSAVEKVIDSEFNVIEKVDKDSERNADQLGYGAVHFIVCLGKKSSGARYDDLKGIPCEIQVRTIMQDAWAIIQHHLVYKHEDEVPKPLQRRLNSLSGLLETADDQFLQIRQSRDEYLSTVKDSSTDTKTFLANETNLDSIQEYLDWKLPGRPIEKFKGQLRLIFGAIDVKTYSDLRSIDKAMDATKGTRKEIPKHLANLKLTAPSGAIPAAVELAWALSIVDKKYRKRPGMPKQWLKALLECIEK